MNQQAGSPDGSPSMTIEPCEYCREIGRHRAFCPATEEERQLEERFGVIRENVAVACGLLAPYVTNEKSLDSYDVSGHSSLRKALEAAKRWVNGEPPQWLYMYSSEPGLGKTHLASAALAARIRAGRIGRFTKFAAMQRDLLSAPFDQKQAVFRKYARPPLLVLDEIGAERASEYSVTLLFEVIDERYDHNLPTWLNSNLSLGELAEKYAPTEDEKAAKRIMNRIYERTGGKDGAGRIQLLGKSWRLR